MLRDADVVGALQVKPELRARAKPMPEKKGGVAGDATSPMDNLGHAIGRDVDLPRKLGRRDAKLGQLVGQDFSGVDGENSRCLYLQNLATDRVRDRGRE